MYGSGRAAGGSPMLLVFTAGAMGGAAVLARRAKATAALRFLGVTATASI